MATYTDSESGTPQSSAREQLSDLLINIFSRSQRLMTPTVGVIAGMLMVLALAGLYAQSRYSLNVVNGQVEEARRALSAPGPDMPPLDEQLQAWESALASAIKARVEAPLDSEFVQTVLGAAQDTGVRLVTASAQRDITVDVAGLEYGASPYLIRVTGEMLNIQAFVRKLEGGLVEALEVTSVVATRDAEGFLLSIGVVVRNELPADPDQEGEPTDGTPAGSSSVDSRAGAGP
ncbi:MAG: hypothetical protein IIB26_06120 [Chloroflexi bacterium]|nr:hypothetical protein [Chloroflexota bacterium]